MKKKFYIGIALIVVMFTLLLIFGIGKVNIGLFLDKLGLTKNTFYINIDKDISSKDLYIYWFGEPDYYIKEDENKLNRILIYHQKIQSDILDSYGKNWFLVKYKNISYRKIGVFKTHAYSKYNYKIDLRLDEDNLIIDWRIKNWYNTEIYQGMDTISIDDTSRSP